MKYIIEIRDINEGYVEVEADNESDASKKAMDAYFMGTVSWRDGDIEIVNIKEE